MSGVIPEGYKKGRRDLYPVNPKVTQNIHVAPRAVGWDLPFGSEERMAFIKEKRYEQANEFIQSEIPKPDEERFMPPPRYNPISLDILSTDEYAVASIAGKLAFGKNFSATESFMKTGKMEDVYYRAEYETGEKIKAGKLGYLDPYHPGSPRDAEAITSGYANQQKGEVSSFAMSMYFSPLTHTSGVADGVGVYINGKYKYLTDEGAKVLSAMLMSAPVKSNKLILHQFGQMVKDNPKLLNAFVQKDGLRIAFTNYEIIPRQYLPHVLAGKGLSYVKQNTWDVVTTAFNRQYTTLLSKFPKRTIPAPPHSFNEIRAASKAELIAAKAQVDKQVADLMADAKKQLGDKFDLNLLTEYAENPSIRASLKALDPIYQRWEAIRKNIASIEKAEGILHNERDNYIRHYLTYAAKKAKGIVTGVKQKAGFDIARKLDGSVAALNYKSVVEDGYKLLDDNFGRIIQKRLYEHETAMNALTLISKAEQQFGKAAKEVAGNKDYVPSPRNPNIYLPKGIATALRAEENVKMVMSLTGQKTKYEVAKDIALYVPGKAYDFQRWTLHTWEKLQTRGFPAFYAINYYGGKFMAWLGGSANIADDAAAIAVMRKSIDPGKVVLTSELDSRIKYTKEDIAKLAVEYKLTKVDPLGVGGFGGGAEQGAAGWINKRGWEAEEELRLSLFLNRLRKGDQPEEAYKYVNKYLFDYTSEMKGADKILQDWIPFYRWQRNAIPFFASQTIESYGKMRAFGVFAAQSWNSPEADVIKPYIPDWAESRINVFMGGKRQDILSFNLPMGTIPDTLRKMNSLGNMTQFLGPVPQIAYQLHEGKETFTGKNITDPVKFIPKFFLNRHISTINKITNNAPWWEVGLEAGAGINVLQGTDLMYYAGAYNQGSERITTEALRRLGGRWHGCGF